MTDNRKWQYGRFCSPVMQFLVVDRCRNHFNLLSSWTSSKISNLALEFRRYLSEFLRCNYFRFWRPYRYDRLSVAVVLKACFFILNVFAFRIQSDFDKLFTLKRKHVYVSVCKTTQPAPDAVCGVCLGLFTLVGRINKAVKFVTNCSNYAYKVFTRLIP